MFSARQSFYFAAGSSEAGTGQIDTLAGAVGRVGLLNDDSSYSFLYEADTNGFFGASNISALGSIDWQKQLSPSTTDLYADMAKDSSGNIYACGYATGDASAYIVAYNSSGAVLWQKRFTRATGGGSGLRISSLVYYGGSIYAVGYDNSSTGTVGYLFKLNATTGAILNKYRIGVGGGSPALTFVDCISLDSSGNIYIAGNYFSGVTYYYGFVLKYSTNLGTFSWGRTFRPTASTYNIRASSIAVDSSFNVYVYFSYGSSAVGLAKFNSAGTTQWFNGILGSSWVVPTPSPRTLDIDSSNYPYLIGANNSTSSNQTVIAQVDPTGTSIPVKRYLKYVSNATAIRGLSISVNGSNMLVTCDSNISGVGQVILLNVPTNGSLTGTYGNYRYDVSTVPNLNNLTSSITVANITTDPKSTTTDITVADGTKSNGNSTLTLSTINL